MQAAANNANDTSSAVTDKISVDKGSPVKLPPSPRRGRTTSRPSSSLTRSDFALRNSRVYRLILPVVLFGTFFADFWFFSALHVVIIKVLISYVERFCWCGLISDHL